MPLGSFMYSLRLKERSVVTIPALELRGQSPWGMFTDAVDTVEYEPEALGGARYEREEMWLDEILVIVLDPFVRIVPLMAGSDVDSG